MVDFKKYIKQNSNPYDAYVSINGEEIDINCVLDKSITLEQYKTARANSEGFKVLYSKLNNEALKYAVENCLFNCGYTDAITYNGLLQTYLVPELLKRL